MRNKPEMTIDQHLTISKKIRDLESDLRNIQGHFSISSTTGKCIYKFLSTSILELKDKLDNEFCEIKGAVDKHGFVYFNPDKKVKYADNT